MYAVGRARASPPCARRPPRRRARRPRPERRAPAPPERLPGADPLQHAHAPGGAAVTGHPCSTPCRARRARSSCAELTPHAGEVVVTKYRSSGFWGTNLELLLRSNGIKTRGRRRLHDRGVRGVDRARRHVQRLLRRRRRGLRRQRRPGPARGIDAADASPVRPGGRRTSSPAVWASRPPAAGGRR